MREFCWILEIRKDLNFIEARTGAELEIEVGTILRLGLILRLRLLMRFTQIFLEIEIEVETGLRLGLILLIRILLRLKLRLWLN